MEETKNKQCEQAQDKQALGENELDEVAGGHHTPRRPRETDGTSTHWVGIIK